MTTNPSEDAPRAILFLDQFFFLVDTRVMANSTHLYQLSWVSTARPAVS